MNCGECCTGSALSLLCCISNPGSRSRPIFEPSANSRIRGSSTMADDANTAASVASPNHVLGQDARIHSKTFKGGQLSTSNAALFQVLSSCPSLKSGFSTSMFMTHPLLQTYVGSHCRSAAVSVDKCIECHLSDGGLVTLDLSLPGKISGHLALIIPGAAGGSDVPYIKSLAKRLFDAGFLVAILNRRGTTAHTPLKTSELRASAVCENKRFGRSHCTAAKNVPRFCYFCGGCFYWCKSPS